MFSCEIREIFKNTFFTEQLWTTASVIGKSVLILENCGNLTSKFLEFLWIDDQIILENLAFISYY